MKQILNKSFNLFNTFKTGIIFSIALCQFSNITLAQNLSTSEIVTYSKLADIVYKTEKDPLTEEQEDLLKEWEILSVDGKKQTSEELDVNIFVKLYHLAKGVRGFDISGFAGAAYRNKNDNRIVVAFRGTDMNRNHHRVIRDLILDDFDDIFIHDRIPSQYKSAKKFYEKVKKEYGKNNISAITGHSLGGALAQLVGSMEKIQTVTFNAPGMLQAANKHDFDDINEDYVVNYVWLNDYVGNFRDHIGATYYFLPVPINSENPSPLTDTHCVLPYNIDKHGKPLEVNEYLEQNDGISLWYYDAHNSLQKEVDFINHFIHIISHDAYRRGETVVLNFGPPLQDLNYIVKGKKILINTDGTVLVNDLKK